MAPRLRRHAAILAALVVVVAIAAACVPVTPPPAPKPKPKPTPTTQPPPPIACQALGDWEDALSDPAATTYEVVVDDGVGAPDFETVEATTPTELAEEVAEIESTVGPVTDVGPEVEVGLLAVVPSNDPRYGAPAPNGGQQKLALDHARFDDAWTAGEDGAGVVVAVVDTGVQGNHPDLASNLLPGADFVSSSGGTACTDPNSHGTHVAGIIAQVDNALGGIGGAPGAKILPVRVLNSNGAGTSTDVAEGITWAADHGAKVINLSLGGYGSSSAINTAIAYAVGKNATVVAAGGNDGQFGSPPVYPAAANGSIAVGALNTGTTSRASFSNTNTYLDIAAPGTSIDSTIPTSGYGLKSGTSMSTPFVSAVVALIRRDCALSQAGMLARLQASATQAVSGFAGPLELVDAAAAASACS
jgi:subtilisin family serine protease